MGKEISWETRVTAEELYVCGGLTYAQVAAKTGVSESQLQRWGAEDGWVDQKKAFRQDLASIERDKVKLRADLIKKALKSLNPQDVFAISSLESATAKAAKATASEDTAAPIAPETQRIIKTPSDAVDALTDAVELRINRMLSGGEIDLKKIKDLQKSMELIEQMRVKYKGGTKTSSQVSQETLETIKRDVYGLDD